MPATVTRASSRRLEMARSEPTTGRWVRVTADAERVRLEIGTTGNRLDAARRVRLSGHDLLDSAGRTELRAWWPVPEVITNRVGQFVADLRGELLAAGSADPGGDLATIAEAADPVLPGLRDPGEPAEPDIVAAVLASAYPLLRRPLTEGARPEVVPVALEPMLRHGDPRSAATETLGRRVTRPLVRALATALLPDDRGEVVWEPLLGALMAAMRCGPEQLTAILTTPVARPGAVRFTVGEVDRARTMFADQHPRRVAETVQEALAEDGGTARLQATIGAWDSRPPRPPPPAPAPRRPVVPEPSRRDPATEPLAHPATWRNVEGAEVAGLRVVLPRTADELVEWGAQMENCLGAYRHAVAVGRTRIMGLARDGRLRMAIEISRSRVLRQLETPGNTRPDDGTARRVVAFLHAHHLIDADARRPA